MKHIAVLFANTFWLLIPILVFNIAFVSRLPPAFRMDVFWRDIPNWISVPENVFRGFVFLMPLIMRLRAVTRAEKAGLVIYGLGTLVYFASWAVLILFPHCVWSRSAVGFMAPAYTPVLWLAGMSLIGDTLTIPRVPYNPWFFRAFAALFLVFHNLHAWTVFNRVS